VADTGPTTWEDPSLVQLWGPRFSAYVVPAVDRGVFTLGRLRDDAKSLGRAERAADRLEAFLDGRRMTYGEAGHAIGVAPNSLRFGAPTGRILIRWEGARQPIVWTVPAPPVRPEEARLELARRFLHVLGPGTASTFSHWGGVKLARARSIVAALESDLIATRTSVGDGWILASDEASFRDGTHPGSDVRLLPSGDTYLLLWNADRALLVDDPARRSELWTPRVWPGALLVDGEVAGTWRRADALVSIHPWGSLTGPQREAVEREATSLPLPGLAGSLVVRWEA
jgi:hypothetical protein